MPERDPTYDPGCLFCRLAAEEIPSDRVYEDDGVIVFRDIIVSRERRLEMLHLAEHDALTDLPNRLLLNDRLARTIALDSNTKIGLVAADRLEPPHTAAGVHRGDTCVGGDAP